MRATEALKGAFRLPASQGTVDQCDSLAQLLARELADVSRVVRAQVRPFAILSRKA